jgi:hypothetical protein
MYSDVRVNIGGVRLFASLCVEITHAVLIWRYDR